MPCARWVGQTVNVARLSFRRGCRQPPGAAQTRPCAGAGAGTGHVDRPGSADAGPSWALVCGAIEWAAGGAGRGRSLSSRLNCEELGAEKCVDGSAGARGRRARSRPGGACSGVVSMPRLGGDVGEPGGRGDARAGHSAGAGWLSAGRGRLGKPGARRQWWSAFSSASADAVDEGELCRRGSGGVEAPRPLEQAIRSLRSCPLKELERLRSSCHGDPFVLVHGIGCQAGD